MKLKHLSYSGLKLFEEDRRAFYLQYLAENAVERSPQSKPMAAGSAFDSYVKTYLSRALGMPADLDAAFESAVEPQHRDFGRVAGRHLLTAYIRSGMCHRLFTRLESAEFVRFEGEVVVEVEGMRLKGFLDLETASLILDWKVNGFCSASTTSPNPGYKLCMDGWRGKKQSRSHGKTHKENRSLAESFQPWSDQLSMYSLMLGRPMTGMIHQLVGKPVRVAEFEGPITEQDKMLARLRACWDAVANDQIFEDPEMAARLEITAAQMRIHHHVAV